MNCHGVQVIADAKLSRDLDELRQLRLSQAKQLDEKGFAQEISGYQKRAAAWIASLPKQNLGTWNILDIG